jgi:branched-chain amino acid transport system substrate-binding protein
MWKKMDIKTVAILYVDTDYGQGLRDVFRRRYLSLGGSISIEESYEQGSTDFRTQLSKIKQKKTQWIYMPGYYSEVAKAMAQARQLGANSRFFSNIGAADPKLFEIGKGAVDGLLITAPKLDLASGDSLTTDFLKSFEARFNRTPGFPAAYAFDTMLLVAEAMKRKGFDGVEIKQGLYSIKDFPGVTGKTTFDRNGDVIKEFIVEVARGDKFERFDTVD